MEGQVRTALLRRLPALAGALCYGLFFAGATCAQQSAPAGDRAESSEITLRKSVKSREYQGKVVEGEERTVGRGDSLWRILVQEKGLPEKRFRSYLVVIRGLNPQVKDLNVLRIGDTIFIPLRPDQAAGFRTQTAPDSASARAPLARGATTVYRVKSGDHLYQILREQLGIRDERQLASIYALTKDLNPERKNWDILQEGEMIRLPTTSRPQEVAAVEAQPAPQGKPAPEASPPPEVNLAQEPMPSPPVASAPSGVKRAQETKPPPPALDLHQVHRLPATENMALLGMVVETLGGQIQREGEEVVALKDGTVRIDRSNYPVVYNPKLRQKVVIDPQDKIPASLRKQLSDPSVATPVMAMAGGVSLHDAVSQLLSSLGYQALPADRPVVIQDAGVAYEAKGIWTALAPEENNKAQEIYVINLTDQAGAIPEYLVSQLARKGLHLQEVLLPTASPKPPVTLASEPKGLATQIKTWSRDKREIVDSLLLTYGIPFGVAEALSVDLREGFRIDARSDRVFDLHGRRTALFFQRTEPEIKEALQEKQGIKIVELELASLSSREIIGRLLNELGEQGGYREHRFSAASGALQDRLIVSAWGFLLNKRSMFLTDREIPPSLHRFFFDKGLEIVYFQ